jgi:hypothetical protein
VSHWLEFEPVDWLGWLLVVLSLAVQLVAVELIKWGLRLWSAKPLPALYKTRKGLGFKG